MKNFNETNQKINEQNLTSEVSSVKETVDFNENTTLSVEATSTDEYSEVIDAPVESKKKAMDPKLLATISTTFVAVVVASIIGFTNLLNVRLNAEFSLFSFEDGAIVYDIAVEDRVDEELFVYVYDGENNLILKHSVEEEAVDGIISEKVGIDMEQFKDEIEAGKSISLNATLRGLVGLDVERAFDNYKVEIDVRNSTFSNVDAHCNCSNDGYYYFLMNFVDDYGMFNNFSAHIVDQNDNIFNCTFSDNLHEEQKIYVRNAHGGSATLIINYYVGEEKQEVIMKIKI